MKKKTPASLLVVGLTLPLVALLAACGGSSTTTSNTTSDRAAGPGDMSAVFRQALDALVDKGTITTDQDRASSALSLGITPALTAAGKVVIILTMFAGRVGIISMAARHVRRPVERRIDLPREEVLIG